LNTRLPPSRRTAGDQDLRPCAARVREQWWANPRLSEETPNCGAGLSACRRLFSRRGRARENATLGETPAPLLTSRTRRARPSGGQPFAKSGFSSSLEGDAGRQGARISSA
jgi:hypothetical protein